MFGISTLSKMLFAVITLSLITSCNGIRTSDSRATSTAQADRAIRMATAIAEDWHSTTEVIHQQALATADASLSLFEETSKWPLAFNETYNENSRGWAEGSEDDPEYANSKWSIEDGKYIWEAEAYDGFIWWVRPDMEMFSDFQLAVNAKPVINSDFGEYGLIFRQMDAKNYYLFELDGRGNYAFYINYQGEWESLLGWKYSSEIVLGEENRLSVIAKGDEYLFFINDAFIDAYQDDRLKSGRAGLLIGLGNPGEEGAWEFDDFVIRVMSENAGTGTPTP